MHTPLTWRMCAPRGGGGGSAPRGPRPPPPPFGWRGGRGSSLRLLAAPLVAAVHGVVAATEEDGDGDGRRERESRSPFLPPLLPFLFAPFFPAEGGREGATDSSAPPPPPPIAPATTVPLQLNARGPHGREASEARQSPIHRQASPTPPEAITPNSHSPFPSFVSSHFCFRRGLLFHFAVQQQQRERGRKKKGGGKKSVQVEV